MTRSPADTVKHTPLPGWNDLPDELRAKLVEEGRNWCEPGLGGDAALCIYNVVRDNLPPQIFPLFQQDAAPASAKDSCAPDPVREKLVEALEEAQASLSDLDDRLIDCGPLHTAQDAYDSSYRGMVIDAITTISLALLLAKGEKA